MTEAATPDPILLTTFPCRWCGRLLAGYVLESSVQLTDWSAMHTLAHIEMEE